MMPKLRDVTHRLSLASVLIGLALSPGCGSGGSDGGSTGTGTSTSTGTGGNGQCGSNEIKIESNSFGSYVVKRGGMWAMEGAANDLTRSDLYSYTAAGVRKYLGCINGENTTVHASALTQDALYMSIYRKQKSVILRYPL